MNFLHASALAGATALAGLSPAGAQDLTPVSFSLDWAYQGNHALWALAIENGYFEEQGLDVTMDRGFGSGDTVSKVAAGTYDIGFADINAAIKFNAENPDSNVVAFYQVMDRTPNSIIALAGSGIESVADLEGKTLGAPEADSSRLMFPAFAEANDLDTSTIEWTNMAPNMREALLVQGRVDAIAGFSSTSLFNVMSSGVPREDVTVLPYAENGLDLYGSALIATPQFISENPEVIEGFVEATVAGTIAMLEDPEAGMEALQDIEPLFDTEMELDRLTYLIDNQVLVSPAFRENGLGYVDPERMDLTISTNSEIYGFEPPASEDVYTTDYLPEASERMPPES